MTTAPFASVVTAVGGLRAVTGPGERAVALAEELAPVFGERADTHDRENTFVAENFEDMRKAGLLGACAPEDLGGGGLLSVHDLTVVISRLARGCPSTAIAVNMHLSAVLLAASSWEAARERGETEAAAAMEPFLRSLATGELIVSGAGTEAGVDTWIPRTEIVPTDGAYLLRGRKVFATNCEIADVIRVRARVRQEDGTFAQAFVNLKRDTPGIEVRGDWDALGMRGSGSHTVDFEDCRVPAEAVTVLGPLGPPPAPAWPIITASVFPLLGANLGIAETARDHVVGQVRERGRYPYTGALADRPSTQRFVAEIEAALLVIRSTLSCAGRAVDDAIAAGAGGDDEVSLGLASMAQCAKLVVDAKAAEVVDLALTVSGGAGFLASSPLSRLYRDVRAGPFMQPYSPNEAYEFIGRITLGRDPFAELTAALEEATD